MSTTRLLRQAMCYTPAVKCSRPIRSACRPVALAARAPSTARLIGQLAEAPGLVVLESAHDPTAHGRWTIVSCDPVLRLEQAPDAPGDPFAALADILEHLRVGHLQVPCAGGFIGGLGYECARLLERHPGQARLDLGLPAVNFGLYDTVFVHDRATGSWFVAGIDLPRSLTGPRAGLAERLDHAEATLVAAADLGEPPDSVCSAVPPPAFDEVGYLDRVRRILAHIRAGDIYQANLTTRFDIPTSASAIGLYRRLCRMNPANYAALLCYDDHAVVSASPELFLEVRDRAVLTRPIKGTRPRSADPIVDAAHRAELRHSAKDLAELAMIVDLQRNDLSRVCSGVGAAWPPQLEAHPTVYHLVADVRGTLDPGVGLVELLRATFPGGSITGCPKIRAMEVIDDLEPVARGPYCGALGWIGLDGAMTLSIAIRTMILRAGIAHVHVGGGIVADSDPAEECREIFAKAAGLFAALGIQAGRPERVGS